MLWLTLDWLAVLSLGPWYVPSICMPSGGLAILFTEPSGHADVSCYQVRDRDHVAIPQPHENFTLIAHREDRVGALAPQDHLANVGSAAIGQRKCVLNLCLVKVSQVDLGLYLCLVRNLFILLAS